jgi:hypothetical protein
MFFHSSRSNVTFICLSQITFLFAKNLTCLSSGFPHQYSFYILCPNDFPGQATTLTSQIRWNHAKRRTFLQQRKCSGITRRANKMGRAHVLLYENSFYIDSTELPSLPLPTLCVCSSIGFLVELLI